MDEDSVGGTARNFGGKVEQAAGDLTGDSKLQAEGMTDQFAGKVQAGLGRARDGIRSTVDSLSDQARTAASGLQDQAGTAGETLTAMVKEQPMAAILTASAVGYLVAFLIHRR